MKLRATGLEWRDAYVRRLVLLGCKLDVEWLIILHNAPLLVFTPRQFLGCNSTNYSRKRGM